MPLSIRFVGNRTLLIGRINMRESCVRSQVKQVKEGVESVQDGVHNPRKPVKVPPVFPACQ